MSAASFVYLLLEFKPAKMSWDDRGHRTKSNMFSAVGRREGRAVGMRSDLERGELF